MSFLEPSYLFALAAVAIPILVHIFSRRRVPQIRWSSIRFLRPADRRSMVKVELRRLILLLLRVLAVALVALAFARPVVRGKLASLFPSHGSRAVCILLDRSFSMGLTSEGGTAFDSAKKRLAEIVSALDEGDQVAVVLFDTRQEIIYDARADAGAIGAALAREVPSWSPTDLRAAVAFARDFLLSSQSEVRELVMISDFQRSGLVSPANKTENQPIRALLVPIQEGEIANAAVERVATPRAVLHRGETARVYIFLRNTDRNRPARFAVEVSAEGRRLMEREVEIAPGGFIRETAIVPAEKIGFLEGTVRKSLDRLAADDERRFTLQVRYKARVLLITDRENIYLEQALAPEGIDGDIELERKSSRSFTSSDLSAADAVVIGPGRDIERDDLELLGRFVERGGTLLVLVLPGLEKTVEKLSRHSIKIGFREMEQGFATVEPPSDIPSIMASFGQEDISALAKVRFRSFAFVEGVPQEAILLSFSDGAPFVWLERAGEGALLFACIDPRPQAGELVLSPFFLPLMQGLVLYSGSSAETDEGALVGEPVIYPSTAARNFEIEYPDGSVWKPAYESSRAAPEKLEILPSEKPGFLTIREGENMLGKIAVNPDCSRESDLSRLSPEEAADSLGLEHSAVLGGSREARAAISEYRRGKEITMPLLLVAAAVLVAELVFSQRKLGEGESDVG